MITMLYSLTMWWYIVYKPITSVEFEYHAFDEYYLGCRSYHGGAGVITVNSDGSYEALCRDGHSPTDEHPRIRSTKLIGEKQK